MSSTYLSSGSSSSGSKSTPIYKPVYKLITFEDVTPRPTQKQKNLGGEAFKSWRDHSKTEAWLDQSMVDREIKDWPVSGGTGYIKSLLSMGKRRREILDNYLKTLNETDKSEDMMGMWEPEYLFPGDPVIDKKSGVKIRPPELFWVIIKRQKRVPELGSKSSNGNNAPKGVLKDDKKSSSGLRESDVGPLIRELLDAVTRLNTKDNLPDVQAQLQQVIFVLSKLQQNQNQVPVVTNPYPQMQGLLPFQEPPTYSRLSLPSNLPQYHQFQPSPEDSQQLQRMNHHMQHMQQNVFDNRNQHNPHHDISNRPRQAFDDDEGYTRNSHLNSIEPPNYPRGGAGSRRHSVSSLHSQPVNVPDEMMLQMKYDAGHGRGGNGGNMFNPDMQARGPHMITNHPHNLHHHSSRLDLQKRHMVESWQHDSSSSSVGSDEEYRVARPESRADSMYNPGHLRNSRPRSSTRGGGGDVDLTSGNRSRRNSVSFSDRNGGMMPGHGRMIGMGKGYGSGDSGSEDGMHDQRMMMHHGMSINRGDTRTPAPWPHHK